VTFFKAEFLSEAINAACALTHGFFTKLSDSQGCELSDFALIL